MDKVTNKLLSRWRIVLVLISFIVGISLTFLFITDTNANGLDLTAQIEQKITYDISENIIYQDFKEFPGLKIIEASSQRLIIELNTPEFQVVQNDSSEDTCQEIKVEGFGKTVIFGAFQLPVKGVVVGIPPQSSPSLTILETERNYLHDIYEICPLKLPVYSIGLNGDIHVDGYQNAKNTHDEFYDPYSPQSLVRLRSTGYIRNQRVAQLIFQPFQYNQATGEILYYSRIRVQLDISSEINIFESLDPQFETESFELILQNLLINYEQSRYWRSSPSKTPYEISDIDNDGQQFYKVFVDQDGIYKVSYSDLQAAGVPVDSLDLVDPDTLQLLNNGVEVAIYIAGEEDSSFDPNDYFLFYGEQTNSKYTETNIYWLTWGTDLGHRMIELDGTPGGSADIPLYFKTVEHLEENHWYQSPRPSGIDKDRWYWDFITTSGSPVTKSFTTTLTNLASSTISPTVRGLFRGYTAIPQHHTRVYINGHLIDDAYWPAENEYFFEVEIPQSHLVEGTNSVTIECPMENGETSEIILFNWFEIEYSKSYIAQDDLFSFDGELEGNWEFKIGGFSTDSLEFFDITDPFTPTRIINVDVIHDGSAYVHSFEQNILNEHQYIALSDSNILNHSGIVVDNPSNLLSTSNSFDYIIITHSDFYTSMLPLAEHRSMLGLRTIVVDVQDIYDELNFGILSPEAIRDFLSYAYNYWTSPAPEYVLLVGDGNYDLKNYLGTDEKNYIPPYLEDADPWLGEVAADNRYVCVSGEDTFPDMHLGRLPIKTSDEANNVVEKILNYENNPTIGDWNQRALFVADNADEAGDFGELSDYIADDYLDTPYVADKIYYGITLPTLEETRSEILNAINQGRLLVNYIGHSSLKQWASESLFSVDEISSLSNNNNLPVMVSMTCLDGAYHYPSMPDRDDSSLAERLVRAENKGAIASFSPTGFGIATGHDYLNKGLFDALFTDDVTQLGPATTQAKLNLFANTGLYQDLLDTYLLFGDPALQLNVLPAETSLSMSVDPPGLLKSGDPITYTLSYTNNGPATAHHVTISDTLPSMLINLSVESSGPEITLQVDSTYIWDVTDLNEGDVGTITLTATINPSFSGIISNTAIIATTAREFETSDNRAGPVFTSVGQPTSTLISSFEAVPQPDSIQVNWETVNELDLIGFNLYRSESITGELVKRNQALIPAKTPGGSIGNHYQFIDQPVEAGTTYYYWLEVVTSWGSNMSGPAVASTFYVNFSPLISK